MRFQAEIPNKDAMILRSLMRELEVQNNAELFGHLLWIMSWAVSERREGRKVASMSGDGKPVKELVSPLLERVAPQNTLPQIEIQWTEEELKDLANLMSAEPALPNERLVRLMKRK